MTDNFPSIKYLSDLMKLMSKYQIDFIELPSIKLSKKLHQGKSIKTKSTLPIKTKSVIAVNGEIEDDIIFASTSAPKMSLEDFNRFASNPVPVKGS